MMGAITTRWAAAPSIREPVTSTTRATVCSVNNTARFGHTTEAAVHTTNNATRPAVHQAAERIHAKRAATFGTDATLLGVLHGALVMIATPTTDELLTDTATAPHRMFAALDRQCGCSCEPWSCIRHASTCTPALKWPHVASSRTIEYRTDTNTSAGTKAGARTAAPAIGLATSTSNPTYAPKLIPAVIPTATLGTYATVIPTPATELALGSATPAPSPAAATVAYCIRGFYNGQYSAVCNTACGSTYLNGRPHRIRCLRYRPQ